MWILDYQRARFKRTKNCEHVWCHNSQLHCVTSRKVHWKNSNAILCNSQQREDATEICDVATYHPPETVIGGVGNKRVTFKGGFTHSMPFPCHAVPLRVKMCLSHLIYTVRPCLIHTCHAAPMPCSHHAVLLNATAQCGRRDGLCAASVRLLPATTQSSTKIVIRSIPIWDAGGQYETQRSSWTRKSLLF